MFQIFTQIQYKIESDTMNTVDVDIIMFDDWNFKGEDKVVQHKLCTDNTEHVEDNQEANISQKPSPSGIFVDGWLCYCLF